MGSGDNFTNGNLCILVLQGKSYWWYNHNTHNLHTQIYIRYANNSLKRLLWNGNNTNYFAKCHLPIYIPVLTPTLLIQYFKKKMENINHTPKALLCQAPKLHSMMMHNYGTFKQHLRMCHRR